MLFIYSTGVFVFVRASLENEYLKVVRSRRHGYVGFAFPDVRVFHHFLSLLLYALLAELLKYVSISRELKSFIILCESVKSCSSGK